MIRFLTGLTAGLALAYLTAPQQGKAMRKLLTSLIHDELDGVRLIGRQWQATLDRTQQAWAQLKTAAGFSPVDSKPARRLKRPKSIVD